MNTKEPFEALVAAHGATVLRVCWAVLGPDEADDAWQETFLAALGAYPALPADANVEAWLVRIAHRKAIDVVRARRRAPVPVSEPGEATEAGAAAGHNGSGGDPQDAGEYELWAQVKDLPDKQRRVLAYRYLGGLAYADIAEILGGTPEAARRAGADGISALRRTLAFHPDDLPTVQRSSR